MLSTTLHCRALLVATFSMAMLPMSHAAESGLISKPSNHSVQETVERFEQAVKRRNPTAGWSSPQSTTLLLQARTASR
jgi:hypothetical protein